ncbi:MAG: DUF2793 domain-containing protein [Porphyrobacter sp. IPPAS B-1204]|nr:MAG: DUF2793 domain-containing protein [Porphyrobacter sp. IPPAS B-1204]
MGRITNLRSTASASAAERRRSCSRRLNPKACAVRSTATPAGQAQKEFFVNQALCLLDALHARCVSASQPSPPSTPSEGACFRITAPASAAWAGKEDHLAVRISGGWHFITPQEGMVVFDQSASQQLVFRSTWARALAPSTPTGGTTIDTQAREAIAALIQALVVLGLLGTSGN